MTAAYTSFANGGIRLSPIFVNSVRNSKGDIVVNFGTEKNQVLDRRIAFVMTNLMEGVMNFGTAAGVRTLCLRLRRRGNGHVARRLVRGIHQQAAVHRVGGI